jgi:hypothetical protein
VVSLESCRAIRLHPGGDRDAAEAGLDEIVEFDVEGSYQLLHSFDGSGPLAVLD